MSRRRLNLLLLPLLLITALLLPAAPAGAAEDAGRQPEVLLLYDSLASGTPRGGNIRELQHQLAAYHVQVTLLSLNDYEQGVMNEFSRVIAVINERELPASKGIEADLAGYKGQYLHIGYNPPDRLQQAMKLSTGMVAEESAELAFGPFREAGLMLRQVPYIAASSAERLYGSLSLTGSGRKMPYAASSGSFTYVPYLEAGNAGRLAMAEVLKDWLGAGAPAQTYLVIKEIYPFSDLTLLEKLADRLYEAGIPFIASVRPVFSNTGFPAMQRYLEALKSVQSKNGSILVNAPVVMPSINSNDRTLNAKMNSFINLLVENGIAPLGMGADLYWTYDKEYSSAGMAFFDSVVLFPDENVIHMEKTNVSVAFASSLYSVTPEFLSGLKHEGKAIPQLPADTAVTVDLPEDEAGLEALLQTVTGYWIAFADYKQTVHKVVTDAYTVDSADGVIRVNGSPLNLGYAPEAVSSDFQYQEEQYQSFKALFSVQNQFFIVVIAVALLFFGVLLLVGYRLYRKKYLK